MAAATANRRPRKNHPWKLRKNRREPGGLTANYRKQPKQAENQVGIAALAKRVECVRLAGAFLRWDTPPGKKRQQAPALHTLRAFIIFHPPFPPPVT